MSYTLRGRIESRLAGALLPVVAAAVVAAVLGQWWPVVLAGIMVGLGLLLDVVVYDRLLPYQPGWAAVPLGVLELAVVMGFAVAVGVGAPLGPALALFAGAWLLAQVGGHAAFPLARHTYAEDGGELGRLGAVAVVATVVLFAFTGGVAWGTRPPTVHLAAGIHQGPIVIDTSQRLVGEPGAVVRGTIKVRADDVTIRNVTVLADEIGIDVDQAENVILENVTVREATLDAIQIRRSHVVIRDCVVSDLRDEYAQGIDISFSLHRAPSVVRGCHVTGGFEGIVIHSASVQIEDNEVQDSTLRAITLTEMGMGHIVGNHVQDALGVGIFCGDYSHCVIDDNTVVATRPDEDSSDLTRSGFGLVVHFGAKAEVGTNDFASNPRMIGVFSEGQITGMHD